MKEKPVCEEEGYEWTTWLDRDNPGGVGDFETLADFGDKVCRNPLSMEPRQISPGSNTIIHQDLNVGFWCINSEQPNGGPCADFEVRLFERDVIKEMAS